MIDLFLCNPILLRDELFDLRPAPPLDREHLMRRRQKLPIAPVVDRTHGHHKAVRDLFASDVIRGIGANNVALPSGLLPAGRSTTHFNTTTDARSLPGHPKFCFGAYPSYQPVGGTCGTCNIVTLPEALASKQARLC